MSDLAKKKCLPCKVGTPPLRGEELKRFLSLVEDWELAEEKEIHKTFSFKNFKEALGFVNEIGRIAEEEGHHPDIELSWGKVVISLSTHKIKGLSESDFVLAAKCDTVYTSRVH